MIDPRATRSALTLPKITYGVHPLFSRRLGSLVRLFLARRVSLRGAYGSVKIDISLFFFNANRKRVVYSCLPYMGDSYALLP